MNVPSRTLPRVVLSMLTLVPGGMGGTETYARELGRELARSGRVSASVLLPAQAAGFVPDLPEVLAPEIVPAPSTAARLRTVATSVLRRGRLLGRAPRGAVLHYPFTATVPLPRRGDRVVQSLHDVQHLDMPHLFSRAELWYRRLYYDRAALRADRIITISEFSKQRIVHHLGVPPERITVAHLAVDTAAFTPQLGPRERFLLYPARGWAHKNHERLLEAVRLLREDDPDLRLVLTGGGLDGLGELPDWVDARGNVPRAELLELYRTAACLVFPSLYEGFGMPPLEAMASGCPVAASSAGSLPEVCGDAAALFDPTDPRAIADGVRAALADTEGLQRRGLERARLFTWAACAAAHEDAYLAAHTAGDRA
ncbi:glycosyltransferase family 1 protein [Cellulomonas sp. PS-H5]|uniref:glycosyltransferase family 4 protein n=1 Tax=Cellulomonas sp. PS-H5 TaxID=2820400 RepID=UPI001C4F8B24|nr:glycosyltransferase family 1 protein [Cellulomonas sp. PS-H5]MBW0254612.1 glycosyltransferase family 4 protein [Cellulomonas sp. PS-H5]